MTHQIVTFSRDHAHLATANYVVNFALPDPNIRLEQAAAEKAFRSVIAAQSTQTNVPDAFDPNAARIVLSAGNKSILISQTACQLSLNFPDNGKATLEEQWDVITKNVNDFHRGVLALKDSSDLQMSSIIVGVNFVSTSAIPDLGCFVAGKYVRPPFDRDVASAQVALGYRRGDYYVNVNASMYERRDIGLPAGVTQFTVKIDTLPVVERGITLQLDVNNRPRFMDGVKATVESPDRLLPVAREWANEQIAHVVS